MAETYYIADLWCDLTNWGDPSGARYCKLAARGGMNQADAVMYPNPRMPSTVPPPPLDQFGNSAIPYDTIQDYLIAAQQAKQRIQTSELFNTVADGFDVQTSTGVNWLTVGTLAVIGYIVVKKVL